MRWLLFSLFLLPVFSLTTSEAQDKKFHVCFFELDNQTTSKNFEEHEDFKKSLSDKVEVHRFRPKKNPEENPEKTTLDYFKDMITETSTAEKRCDSLVFSGHHTINWTGKFGNKSLKLKDIENLSCDPEYREWFKNIKALWLDGCNTVTDNAVQAQNNSNPPTGDTESVRVSESEVSSGEDINKYQLKNLSQFYSFSLDKNTPFSSRYLRAFPDTQIYGFNGPAPTGAKGENQVGNISFIADHLKAIGEALEVENSNISDLANQVLKNPSSTSAQKTLAEQIKKSNYHEEFIDLANNILNPNKSKQSKEKIATKLASNVVNKELVQSDIALGLEVLTNDPCKAVKTWNDLQIEGIKGIEFEAIKNKKYEEAKKLGCDLILAKQVLNNPNSASAQKTLAKKIQAGNYPKELVNLANNILDPNKSKQSKENATKLAQQLILKTLDTIEKEKSSDDKLSLSHLLFHNIHETWTTAKKYNIKNNDTFFTDVQKKLQSKNFKDTLTTRIKDNQTSSLIKANYIKFYMDVNNKKDNKGIIDDAIKDLVTKSACSFKRSNKSPCHSVTTLQSPIKPIKKENSRRILALSVADQLLQYDLLNSEQKKTLLDSLLKTGNDAFSKSINIRFQVDIGGENDQDTNHTFEKETFDKFSPEEQELVITELMRHDINHFQDNPNKMMEKLNSYGTGILDRDNATKLTNPFWTELESYLNNKTQEESKEATKTFITDYLAKKDNEGYLITGYLRTTLKHYGNTFLDMTL